MHNVNFVKTGQDNLQLFGKKKNKRTTAFATASLHEMLPALACCVRPGHSCLQSSPPSHLEPFVTTHRSESVQSTSTQEYLSL